MSTLLSTLRQTPQPTPAEFLKAQPGCWILYSDDTGRSDAAKALAVRFFNQAFADRKQREGCAVGYTLQGFGEMPTEEELLCVRNLGIDVDLTPGWERTALAPAELDRRKEAYLRDCLWQFPLKPHWLVETGRGFQVVYRVQPLRGEDNVRRALEVNRQLVAVLRGDPAAVLLTQALGVPGTLQFTPRGWSFRCPLLLDNAAMVAPYELQQVEAVLRQAGEAGRADGEAGPPRARPLPWAPGLAGVPEEPETAAAGRAETGGTPAWLARAWREIAPAAGAFVDAPWQTGCLPGPALVPTPEPERRPGFESIDRREQAKGQQESAGRNGNGPPAPVVRIEVRIKVDGAADGPCGKDCPVTSDLDTSRSPAEPC